jgi:hypothetical protein
MTIDSTGLVTILSRANIPAAANNAYLIGLLAKAPVISPQLGMEIPVLVLGL